MNEPNDNEITGLVDIAKNLPKDRKHNKYCIYLTDLEINVLMSIGNLPENLFYTYEMLVNEKRNYILEMEIRKYIFKKVIPIQFRILKMCEIGK